MIAFVQLIFVYPIQVNNRKQQQQQQHSLLSQISWGRLEMKHKRDEKQGDT
jgi:hypothetical protein